MDGCDICMHGCQPVTPLEVLIDKQPVTITPTPPDMIIWTPVTIQIPKPGKYLITSDNAKVRWYMRQDQEEAPKSFTSEMYFEEAGEVTILAYYFTLNPSEPAFEIKMSVTLVDDLVLNTTRGKAELPANTVYKVVFEAMETGVWTLRTTVAGVAMGVTVDSMKLQTSVEITVSKPGDLVELYVKYEDDSSTQTTFVFDWELAEPFQLDVGLGQSPISVPPKVDTYKVVFTAPEDGRFLLNVTSEELSFSEWGRGGFDHPVRTESTQQLTPEMKKGDTFTTWIQAVYDYAKSTNINDTLTIINVGALLDLNVVGTKTYTLDDYDLTRELSYTAQETGLVTIRLENGVFGFKNANGDIEYGTEMELVKEMAAGETLVYYVGHNGGQGPAKQTVTFLSRRQVGATGDRYSFTAAEDCYYRISVVDGEIGITVNGVTQWVAPKEENGQMIATYEVKLTAGDTYVYQVRSNSASSLVMVENVRYTVDMDEMYNQDAGTMLEMGQDYTMTMIPGKEYNFAVPDDMLQLKVKLTWDYKGLTVYVDGQEYKMGTEIYLQDIKYITAKLRNNVPVDVTFSLAVTYASVNEDAVTEGVLPLNKDKNFLVEANSQAKASYTAEAGGTYILTCYTKGARIYKVNEMGEIGELVIAVSNEDYVKYVFQMEADETVEFIILTADGRQMTVKLSMTTPRP